MRLQREIGAPPRRGPGRSPRAARAVDAALAATFAAFVTEGPLTGPSGGGFLLLHEPGRDATVLDCFFAVPSDRGGEMDEVEIDFADASTQVFHVGEASVAVPGLLRGLEEAHERRGRLPWATLFVPALELADRPFAATDAQAFLHEILVPILQREAGGRRVYGTAGQIDATDLVPTLRLLRDVRADALAILLPDLAADLDALSRRGASSAPRGLRRSFGDDDPGAVSRRSRRADRAGGARRARPRRTRVARRGPRARGRARRPRTAPRAPVRVRARPARHTSRSSTRTAPRSALSSTLGSGSGVFRHGFQLNNMLGELDVIGVEAREAGTRLPSMMSPTLVLGEEGEPRLVAGSAGSVRLAGAILQVVEAVVGHGLPVAEAISRPRLHVDDETVHVEGGWSDDVAAALAEDGFDVRRWADRNLFFGGVSAVERRPGGILGAAGDPRRGGHGVVVR